MDEWDKISFREAFCDAVARRVGIGDILAEGTLEAAKKWGRLEEDKQSGVLRFPAWGTVFHWTMPGIEWAYSGLLGAGDPVWHGYPLGEPNNGPGGAGQSYTIEQMLEVMSAKTIPFTNDPFMFSYSWQEEEAKKVREIFEMWAAGIHYKEISNKFNLPKSTLYEIIKNPTYIGKIRYKGTLYGGGHKPIIKEELFNQVNKPNQN